jgi:hypothetical protein
VVLDANARHIYHDLIQSLWEGVVLSTPDQINDECVSIINTVLESVIDCSKKLALTESLIKQIFPSATARQLTTRLVKSFVKALKNWMSASRGQRVYQACLNTAKLQWRSPIEIALLGL